MEAQNFTWSDGIYICSEGQELDLHNNYDFVCFSHDVGLKSVSMWWRRRSSAWVSADLPDEIRLNFSDVHYIRVEPRDPKYAFDEDVCLASFGYDSDDSWADGQFWTEEPADPNWRWSFEFQSGAEIVIGGGDVVVELRKR